MQRIDGVLQSTSAHARLMAEASSRAPVHSLLLEVEDPSVGRRLSELFVAALHCARVGEGAAAPCGSCGDCVSALEGSHPGVVPILPDGNVIPVDTIRKDVLGRIGEKVPGGGFQVFVLHSAELLGEEGANTLLKAVEEPPAQTLFLFLTGDAEAILGTIRSRSQEVPVRLPPVTELLEGCPEALVPRAAASLAAAGYAPGLLEGLEAASLPDPGDGDALRDLPDRAEEVLARLGLDQLLRDSRPTAYSLPLAEHLFRVGLELAEGRWESFAEAAARLHAYPDACAATAEARAKAVVKEVQDEYGKGFRHPVLHRPKAFGRLAATRAAEDLLRAATAALAAALRTRAGAEPFGLAAVYPGLARLAALPEATLLTRARRLRRARRPLLENQNMRMLLEELAHGLRPAPAPAAARRARHG